MQRQDLVFCAQCAESALSAWRGWPHRDKLPQLPRLIAGACEACVARTSIRNPGIAWLNYHSEGSTGLPDYWLLVVVERPNKWGFPFLAAGQCPKCGDATVVSEMHYPNGECELKHNCQRCGVLSLR